MPKRTLTPSKVKKARKQGYRARNSSKNGRKVMKRRAVKGRKRIV